MWNAIFTMLNDSLPNLLPVLLLALYLQSKLNKEFGGLRKEISDSRDELRKEISDTRDELRKDISDTRDELRQDIREVSDRVARIEGRLEPPAGVGKPRPGRKSG